MKKKLSSSLLIGYGSGDFALNLVTASLSFYQLYFYTDIFLIAPIVAGAIILVSRLIQGIMNPIVGVLIDRTDTKWGRKRPYILFSAAPLGLMLFATLAPADIVSEGKICYALVSSILVFTAFSFASIPYASLTAVITRDSHERSIVSGWRMAFAIAGSLAAAGLIKPLVRFYGAEGRGFRAVGIIFGIVVTFILIVTFFSVREKKDETEREEHLPVLQSILLIRHNHPFITLCFMSLFCLLGTNIMAMVLNYYFKYVIMKEELVPMAFIALFATAAAAIPLYVFLSKKWGKKISFISGLSLLSSVLGISYFIREPTIVSMLAIFILAGAGMSTVYLFPFAMVPDTVEYMELKTGRRLEGMLFGFFVLFFNVSAALASVIVGIGLRAAGYTPNVPQSLATKNGITLLMTLVPALTMLISIILICIYPINERSHRDMVERIAQRNA